MQVYAHHCMNMQRGGGGSEPAPATPGLGSAGGKSFCSGPGSVGRAAQETGEELQFLVVVPAADLLQRGVHAGVDEIEPEDLGATAAGGPDQDAAPVGGIAVAVDPAPAFEPVQDAGDGGGMQSRGAGQGARAERAVPVDEVQAFQVGGPQVQAGADAVIEQGQLRAQVAQRLSDPAGEPSPARSRAAIVRCY